jgi:hypothetical protein
LKPQTEADVELRPQLRVLPAQLQTTPIRARVDKSGLTTGVADLPPGPPHILIACASQTVMTIPSPHTGE